MNIDNDVAFIGFNNVLRSVLKCFHVEVFNIKQ